MEAELPDAGVLLDVGCGCGGFLVPFRHDKWEVHGNDPDGEHIDDAGKDLRELTQDIEYQIKEAMEQSDFIILLIDAQTGITPLDETVATMLRKAGAGDRVLVVASKVDSRSWEPHGHEAAALGLGEAICVSSTQRRIC